LHTRPKYGYRPQLLVYRKPRAFTIRQGPLARSQFEQRQIRRPANIKRSKVTLSSYRPCRIYRRRGDDFAEA
jgi:hypothetical protein